MRNLWPLKVKTFLFWSQHGIQTSPGLSKKLMTSSPNYQGHFTSERQLTAKENGTSQLSSIITNISTTYLSSKYKQEQSKNHQRIITVPKLKAITKSKPIIRSHESPSRDVFLFFTCFVLSVFHERKRHRSPRVLPFAREPLLQWGDATNLFVRRQLAVSGVVRGSEQVMGFELTTSTYRYDNMSIDR